MSEKTIVITESEENYDIQSNGLSEFEVIGILECIVFEMKSARQREASGKIIELPDARCKKLENNPKKLHRNRKSPSNPKEFRQQPIGKWFNQ